MALKLGYKKLSFDFLGQSPHRTFSNVPFLFQTAVPPCVVSMSSTELNLWSSFLRESSKRTQSLESTCIIVGDEHCGKRQLSSALCGVGSNKDNNAGYSSVISYNYFDIDDKDMETTARVNTWLFEKNIFDSSYAVLKNACKTDKLIFMLVLDLSKPETCITSLQKWLVKINSFTSKYYNEVSPDNAKSSKQALSDYLKNVRKTKGSVVVSTVAPEDTEMEAEEEVEHFEGNFISEHFGLPIVVVGAKADTLLSDSSAAMKQARELQGRIRSLCLEVGAGLIFTSSVGPSTVNCAELKKYVMHRLYPTQIGMDLSLQEKLEACFIPAGFDTADLIKISTTVKHSAEEVQTRLKSDIAASKAAQAAKLTTDADASTNSTAASNEFKVELEAEQVWLTGLHEFIQQVSASGAPSAAPSATHSRVPSDASAAAAASSTAAAGSAGAGGGSAGASTTTRGVTIAAAATEGVTGDAATAAGIADESATATATTGRTTRSGAAGRSKSIAGGRSAVPAADKKEVGDFFKNLLKK